MQTNIVKYSYSFVCKCGIEVKVHIDYKQVKDKKCSKCKRGKNE